MVKKIVVIIVLTLSIITSFIYLKTINNKEEEIIIEEEIIEPVIETDSLNLIMGGDAVIHGSVYLDNKINGEYDFYYPLSEIKEIVEGYDLAYYNQETLLGGTELGLSHYPQFNSPQEVGDGFIDAGFNIVSLANNHTMDGYSKKGKAYIESSCAYWKDKYEKYGIISAGSYTSFEEQEKIVIGEKNNITYALLSYTYGTNGIYPIDGEEYLVNYIDIEKIQEDVNKYRDKVDLLLVAMHWGEEYTFIETDYQRQLAQELANIDVDIVIGNHAHVIEPVEWIDDTLVFYAFGNIISAQYITGSDMKSIGLGNIVENQKYSVETLSGMLASVNVTKTTIDGVSSVEISEPECTLLYTDYKDRWKVYPYYKLDDTILTNADIYKEYFTSIIKKYDENIEVK